jgi:acylphosphatase
MPDYLTTRAIRATIGGRVQGIGFRYATRLTAHQLGVVGWVRNLPDGSVEVWAQGPEDLVARFRAFLEQGPPGAQVTSIDLIDVDPDPTLDRFEIML